MPTTANNLHLAGYLPLVQMGQGKEIAIGPLHFWSSEDYSQHISPTEQKDFMIQLKGISRDPITCISVDGVIDQNTMINGIYLLYFAASFRSIYFDQDVPRFSPYTKWVLINQSEAVGPLTAEKACINWVDEEICIGLGKALNDTRNYSGFVRAIRYFVDCFFERFEKAHGRVRHPGEFNEPEDILFLTASFESLFDLGESLPASNFKQKFRPMLHLKYSRPVELFWKWVDGFYRLKNDTIHAKEKLELTFRDNPNIEISYAYLGIKLFIYAIYYKLYKYHLIESETDDLFEPPDFKWIHPNEILMYFWSEESILKKLFILIVQPRQAMSEETFADIEFLTTMYMNLMERYNRPQNAAKFIPTAVTTIAKDAQAILNYADTNPDYLPQGFVEQLHARLHESS